MSEISQQASNHNKQSPKQKLIDTDIQSQTSENPHQVIEILDIEEEPTVTQGDALNVEEEPTVTQENALDVEEEPTVTQENALDVEEEPTVTQENALDVEEEPTVTQENALDVEELLIKNDNNLLPWKDDNKVQQPPGNIETSLLEATQYSLQSPNPEQAPSNQQINTTSLDSCFSRSVDRSDSNIQDQVTPTDSQPPISSTIPIEQTGFMANKLRISFRGSIRKNCIQCPKNQFDTNNEFERAMQFSYRMNQLRRQRQIEHEKKSMNPINYQSIQLNTHRKVGSIARQELPKICNNPHRSNRLREARILEMSKRNNQIYYLKKFIQQLIVRMADQAVERVQQKRSFLSYQFHRNLGRGQIKVGQFIHVPYENQTGNVISPKIRKHQLKPILEGPLKKSQCKVQNSYNFTICNSRISSDVLIDQIEHDGTQHSSEDFELCSSMSGSEQCQPMPQT